MGEFSNFFVGTGPGMSFFTGGSEKTSISYFGSMMPSKNNTSKKLTVGNAAGSYQRTFFSWGFDGGFDFGNVGIVSGAVAKTFTKVVASVLS